MTKPLFRQSSIVWIGMLLGIQSVCALFFVSEFVTEVFGLRNWAVTWEIREFLQLAASLGLSLGAVAAILLLRQTILRIGRAERQVRAASGEFFGIMEECFSDWGLSPSERDVALFAVRGQSNAEIAILRGTSQATIKTQMNAVFRKADVTNRAQLISQFVDVLMSSGPSGAGTAQRGTPGAALPEPGSPG